VQTTTDIFSQERCTKEIFDLSIKVFSENVICLTLLLYLRSL